MLKSYKVEKRQNTPYECKAFTLPSSNPSVSKRDLFNGIVPHRIVLGIVESEAFNGHYKKNPYNFKLFDMTHRERDD